MCRQDLLDNIGPLFGCNALVDVYGSTFRYPSWVSNMIGRWNAPVRIELISVWNPIASLGRFIGDMGYTFLCGSSPKMLPFECGYPPEQFDIQLRSNQELRHFCIKIYSFLKIIHSSNITCVLYLSFASVFFYVYWCPFSWQVNCFFRTKLHLRRSRDWQVLVGTDAGGLGFEQLPIITFFRDILFHLTTVHVLQRERERGKKKTWLGVAVVRRYTALMGSKVLMGLGCFCRLVL